MMVNVLLQGLGVGRKKEIIINYMRKLYDFIAEQFSQ